VSADNFPGGNRCRRTGKLRPSLAESGEGKLIPARKLKKGGHLTGVRTGEPPLAIISVAHCALAQYLLAPISERSELPVLPVRLAADEAALILARFYMSPPANPGGLAKKDGVWNQITGPDSTSSVLLPDILVNSFRISTGSKFTVGNNVFRKLFAPKKAPLTGAPAIRRMKTYSAQSGYVYQYYFEGRRELHSPADTGLEFVFTISADRKTWTPASVLVTRAALSAWENSHGREFSSTEHYAIAKLALFQAFDERSSPSEMAAEIRVQPADVEAIVDTLDL